MSTLCTGYKFLCIIMLSSLCILTMSPPTLYGQNTYAVLFIGNSYTGVNNLPQLVHDVALSAGDTLIFDSNTPGGYTLIGHSTNTITQNKIMSGNWDYVVLQGQSQEPIVQTSQFNSGGNALFALIKQYNPCAVTMPYMTWGRKNGDASNCANFPVMCTYQGMDTTLRDRYLHFTNTINGEVSPVSVVWNYLRQNYPAIELYQTDGSHPSTSGSYAAACCFYASIFKKDPTLISFDFGLNAGDAAIIRSVVKTLVYDTLSMWDFKKSPVSDFSYQIGTGTNEVILTSINLGVQQSYLWDFGDGNTSFLSAVTHSYAMDGTYTIILTTNNCDLQGFHSSTKSITIQFCNHSPTVYTTNPWLCNYDTLWTQAANSYQWFLNGALLPETNQYLANYLSYGLAGFSVLATINGCAELSPQSTQTPVWSGYYFDAIGNPCQGDTVSFAVLHANGFLYGNEIIHWYKNDTLLASMNNEDTLLISAQGKYECKVIDPSSNCVLDTTAYNVVYSCGTVGIAESNSSQTWSVYPNPTQGKISIEIKNKITGICKLEILSTAGVNVWTTEYNCEEKKHEADISNLTDGMYYVRIIFNNEYRFISKLAIIR